MYMTIGMQSVIDALQMYDMIWNSYWTEPNALADFRLGYVVVFAPVTACPWSDATAPAFAMSSIHLSFSSADPAASTKHRLSDMTVKLCATDETSALASCTYIIQIIIVYVTLSLLNWSSFHIFTPRRIKSHKKRGLWDIQVFTGQIPLWTDNWQCYNSEEGNQWVNKQVIHQLVCIK